MIAGAWATAAEGCRKHWNMNLTSYRLGFYVGEKGVDIEGAEVGPYAKGSRSAKNYREGLLAGRAAAHEAAKASA